MSAASVSEVVARFDPITLKEMDSVRLMDRTDTKYVFHENLLPGLFEALLPSYRALEVSGARMIHYTSVYFDTPDLRLYHQHQCGKLNRFKIRYRTYVESGISFFEIKFKNNKGRTVKNRIKVPRNMEYIAGPEDELLRSLTPMDASMLKARLHVDFTRITIVNRHSPERVTIDREVTFRNGERTVGLDGLVIVEIKQERARRSEFVELLRERHIRKGSLSKYCFGVARLHAGIRQNNFKPRMIRIQKLKQNAIA